MTKKVRILSIDGGGIRGILPGSLLSYIEEQIQHETKKPEARIGEYFDFIAGTSTGGILSLIYLCPDNHGNFKYGAKEALKIYMDRGDEIFDVSLKKRLLSLGGISDEKYDATELEEALEQYFGDVLLGDALRPCLITSYNIRARKAHFFTSVDASSKTHNFRMRDVGRATSAAPTYFEPIRIKSLYGSPHPLIDGGVFANNPSLCAYAEARTLDFGKILKNSQKPTSPGAKEMLLVSIGTGAIKIPYTYSEFKDAGMISWIKPLIDIMMSGNSETVHYQLKKIYETLPLKDQEDYYRIQPDIINASSEMDNGKLENLNALHEDSLSYVHQNKDLLGEIASKLVANH